jgi:hypothetical protein
MRLITTQGYELLERFGCYVIEACDKCGQLLGSVRYTRKGGRPRKHKTNAERQRVYRSCLSRIPP